DYSRGAPLNTDDHPVVIFGAPRFVYQANTTGYGRLGPFIDHVTTGVDELIASDGAEPSAEAFKVRLRGFIAARNCYLRGLIAGAEGRQGELLSACIESARVSRDFLTGYAQAVQLARQMAATSPQQSREILQQLEAAQPGNPEARQAMRQLFRE